MNSEEINERLLRIYGKGIDGYPKFRVVFSEEITEKRFGEFNEFYGEIFIRSYTGVHEVPKYPWIDGQWVLEMRMVTDNSELLDKVTYEPVYVFPKGLPLNWDAVSFVCNTVLNPPRREWRTENMDRAEEERQMMEEAEKFKKYLDDIGDSYLVNKLHLKEAILNPKGDS